jgi:DNA-binding LacI/PurR family transcriptional regulator
MIIVSLSPHPDELERIRRSGLTAILVDAHHRALPRIVADDVLGGRLATQHLIDLGHRRIGFIGDIPRTPLAFVSSRLRLTGMRRAMAAAGYPLHERLIGISDHSRQHAAELATRMLRLRLPPTGLVCASDIQAAGVLEAAAALGLDVPGELSVTGYDDLELADHLGLTTIRQPLFESGVRAAQRVLAELEGVPADSLREVQDIRLVVRRTTSLPVA